MISLAHFNAYILIQLCCVAGFIIDRPTDGGGDSFSRKLNLPSETIDIPTCGQIDGGAYYNSSESCQCYHGHTFLISGDSPKCMASYGGSEGCNFRIRSESNVRTLNPNSVANNYDIGEVIYQSQAVSRHEVKDIWYWNITWKRPTETKLFYFTDKNLKWTAVNSAKLASKYSGLLFKLDLSACRVTGWKCKTNYESCLFLKFSGSRNYPLPAPQSSRKTTVAPTTSLPPSSSSSSSRQPKSSTRQVLKTSYSSQILRSKTFILPSSSKYSSLQPSTNYRYSPARSTLSQRRTSIIPTTRPFPARSSNVKGYSSAFYREIKSSIITIASTKSVWSPVLAPSSSSKSLTRASTTSKATVRPSVSPTSKTITTSSQDPNGNIGEQKGKSSNAATIAGICVGVFIALFVFFAIFYFRRRKFASKKGNAKRRETVTLQLTANTFINNSSYEGNGSINSTKKTIGNPIYEEKLKCQGSGKNALPGEYVNAGQPEYSYASSDPIYKEVESEAPVYQETGGLYQPLNEPNKPEPGHYQPIDTSTLSRGTVPLQSPVYQVLDAQTAEGPSRPQSPIYQTVEPDAYQAIDQTAVQNNDGFYAELNNGTNEQPPTQEPLYRELDANTNGQLNLDYEEDEGTI